MFRTCYMFVACKRQLANIHYIGWSLVVHAVVAGSTYPTLPLALSPILPVAYLPSTFHLFML
jgi:hypothetical protein